MKKYFSTWSKSWFARHFGSEERTYQETKQMFEYDSSKYLLKSKVNNRFFYIGKFEDLSNYELQERIKEISSITKQQFDQNESENQTSQYQNNRQQQSTLKSKGVIQKLTFQHLIGDIQQIHQDKSNSFSVIQAASQFNCLEMPDPNVTPYDGITGYIYDKTQGPICALQCPAGTVFRNYFLQGPDQNQQMNTLRDVEKAIDNDKNEYLYMKNGYCMPVNLDSIANLSKRLGEDKQLYQECFQNLRIGIHWDTEVETTNEFNHTVCQIYSSALPIAYTHTLLNDWEVFAKLILKSSYDSVLAASYLLALRRNQRVKVFLTKIGAGVFGNKHIWVAEAIQNSLKTYKDAPLDVSLVHRELENEFSWIKV